MRLRGQGGYTLVEVIISAAIGALLLAALTSVVYTSWHASTIASGRVEASSEVRNFEYFAYDDFARSSLPNAGGCVPSSPCTTQPLSLTGVKVSNSTPLPSGTSVTYSWDGSQFLDRTVAGVSEHMATDVTAFSWYVDTNTTVVVSLTVTVQGYSQSQTFRFRPELNP
jgi:prepilin-type N-terminal cleavage/methylation domain-containing protein